MYPHSPQGHDLNIGLMLGRLLHGQETTHGQLAETRDRLERIEGRLTDGDKMFDEMRQAIKDAGKGSKIEIGAAERIIKQGLQWTIGGGVLWYTGSVEQMLKVLAALGAAK